MPTGRTTPARRALRVAGLFAGIGGIELGLSRAGFHSTLLCEIDPGACAVLEKRFPDVPLSRDVREIESLGRLDLLAAGFPCQDLSQAGRTAGITGGSSGLVEHVFRLIDGLGSRSPRWLLLENVPFMLQLQRGKAMRYLVDELERRRFTWAYRVVDTRAFGLPQRRRRVLLLASRSEDPRLALFGTDAGEPHASSSPGTLRGFYWTEGLRGLGWAIDAVPTLKGGSTIGIPSPPAIWDPLDGSITTPSIVDAERLQGFDDDWTLPALQAPKVRAGHRWKLVGNAVSVPVAEWIGRRIVQPRGTVPRGMPLYVKDAWPDAAWGHAGQAHVVDLSAWPARTITPHLRDFLRHERTPLSLRASAGFLSRAEVSSLRFEPGFIDAVRSHVAAMTKESAA